MTFYYTDHATPDSSFIDDIYYNNEDEMLVVCLNNGVTAGYDRVPADVAKAFMETDTLGGSTGAYYNQMIKPHFEGMDTAWIGDEFESSEDEDTQDFAKLRELVRQAQDMFGGSSEPELNAMAPVDLSAHRPAATTRVVDAPAPGGRAEFTVAYNYALDEYSDIYEDDVNLFAATADDALVAAGKIAEIANFGYFKVTAVTRFYN